VCGCGAQGRAQLRALTRVRPVRLVLAVDADARRAEAYAREMSGEMGIDVRAEEDLAGAALQDVAAAGVVYERAVAEGQGRRLAPA
jgi:ornithine cyclodeaminase/alanine dehydrogenase-like protein (mu-crystallin family)